MSEPRLLVGGDAVLDIASDRPTLWLVDIRSPGVHHRAEAIAALSRERERHAARLDAGERLIRDRLARLMLASAAKCRPDGIVVGRSATGAPVVTAPAGWHLSVAARWPDCVIGVAPERLGVDLERVDTALPPIPDVLTARERDWLAALSDGGRAQAFARLWACKESHAKFLGHPRTIDPSKVEALGDRVRSGHGETRCWYGDHDDLVVAVSTGGG